MYKINFHPLESIEPFWSFWNNLHVKWLRMRKYEQKYTSPITEVIEHVGGAVISRNISRRKYIHILFRLCELPVWVYYLWEIKESEALDVSRAILMIESAVKFHGELVHAYFRCLIAWDRKPFTCVSRSTESLIWPGCDCLVYAVNLSPVYTTKSFKPVYVWSQRGRLSGKRHVV